VVGATSKGGRRRPEVSQTGLADLISSCGRTPEFLESCTPQKCPPAGATADFSPSVVSVIRFSGPYSIRERRRRLDGVLVVQAAQHGCRAHERTRCPWTPGFGPRSACRSSAMVGISSGPASIDDEVLRRTHAAVVRGEKQRHPGNVLGKYRSIDALSARDCGAAFVVEP
jgi:hypothetical protein